MALCSFFEIAIMESFIGMETSDCRSESSGAKYDESQFQLTFFSKPLLFLSVCRHPKHGNRQRTAVASNLPIFYVELDSGGRCDRPAAVFLLLDFVVLASLL